MDCGDLQIEVGQHFTKVPDTGSRQFGGAQLSPRVDLDCIGAQIGCDVDRFLERKIEAFQVN